MTVKGGKNKKITYTDNSGENIYNSGVTTNDTSIKLLKNYSKDSYTIANNNEIRTIDASAVLHGISLTGNKSMNLIVGGEDNDTLIGGKGNDTLTGGKGSDIFVYANGDGNDVITDYTSDDRIKITKGTAKVKKNGKDIILTFGNVGRITVKDAADKVVTYIDEKGKINYYPKPTKDSIVINSSTSITVLEEYKGDTFDVGNVKDGNKVKRIDASPVSHDLKIVGNAKANVILGGYGNDMIYGGKNNDTLQGGDGKDIFVYESGDGNDVILDYNSEDTIKITKGTAKVTTKGSDVVFTVDSGKITLQNAAGKTITYIEGDKKKTYGSSASFIEDDTDYELTPNLSSLVQSKAVDYSFLSTSNNLAKKDNLIAYSGKK
jgi:Ca2+-binding RTX toxin-like protein